MPNDMTYTCSVCNQIFEEKYFDTLQQKCILHCDKSIETEWLITHEQNKLSWNNTKVKIFWNYIQYEIDNLYRMQLHDNYDISDPIKYDKVIFPKFEKEYSYDGYNEADLGTNFISFNVFQEPGSEPFQHINRIFEQSKIIFYKCIFLDTANFKKYQFEQPILFDRCTFNKKLHLPKTFSNSLELRRCDFMNHPLNLNNTTFKSFCSIKNCENIQKITFYQSTFYDDAHIQNCIISGTSNFTLTTFKKIADFHESTFQKVNFTNTIFEDLVIFSDTTFKQDINFNYTIFEKLVIFRDSVFEKTLNLRDAIFKNDANFLDMKAILANRETARIIKYQLQKIGNIIEANKYHAQELALQRKDIWKPRNWCSNQLPEAIVFTVHFLSSNHSKNWLLTLFWIIITGSLTGLWVEGYDCLNHDFFNITMKYMSIINMDDSIKEHPTLLFFNKVALGYLYYQFLTAIRKDTRNS